MGIGDACFWSRSGIHEVLGDVSQFAVQMLGRSTQDVEGLICGDALSFHEYSERLAYRLSSAQGGVEVHCPELFVFMGLRYK